MSGMETGISPGAARGIVVPDGGLMGFVKGDEILVGGFLAGGHINDLTVDGLAAGGVEGAVVAVHHTAL